MSFTPAKYEVAGLFKNYRGRLGPQSYHNNKVISSIIACRTSELGGHVYQCDNDECGHEEQSYNSCRNRNCPKCQYSAKQLWVEERVKELLPVPYYHMVFTVPHLFNELMLWNRKVIFNVLFQASQKAVKKLFKTRYEAEPGMISLLHTWGSNLSFHVHIHMLVTGGGVHLNENKWMSCPENYCLPVRGALTKIYRAIFIKELRKLYKKQKLKLPEKLQEPFAFEDLLDQSFSQDWVVYAKKPFSAPIHVLSYLGNYTHRIAFSNHRIVKVEDDRVHFKYKQYKDGTHEKKTMSLPVTEFLRRFLMHVVPRRFVKIRFYGFMAHKNRKKNIASARELIASDKSINSKDAKTLEEIITEFKKENLVETGQCAQCKKGQMQKIRDLKVNDTS